jgi:hypothetical protein
MTLDDRQEYLFSLFALSDETLQLEADDAFINMCGDPDESIRYVMCVDEQKAREHKKQYGYYEKHTVASLVRPV